MHRDCIAHIEVEAARPVERDKLSPVCSSAAEPVGRIRFRPTVASAFARKICVELGEFSVEALQLAIVRERVAESTLGCLDLRSQMLGVGDRVSEFFGDAGDESFESLRQPDRVEPSQFLPFDREPKLRCGERDLHDAGHASATTDSQRKPTDIDGGAISALARASGLHRGGHKVSDSDAGIDPLGVELTVDGHREAITLRPGAPLIEQRQRVDRTIIASETIQSGRHRPLQSGLVGEVRRPLSSQPCDVGFEAGLTDDSIVAGRERFHLGVRQFLLAGHVVKAPPAVATGEYLVDETTFQLDRLPHVDIEAALSDVAQHLDGVVLVPLAQNSAFALLDIGWSPWTIQVMQGDTPRLHVGSDSHLLGCPDKHSDGAASCGVKELFLLAWVLRLVHEPDRFSWQSPVHECRPQFFVQPPPFPVGRTEFGEHQLQCARPGVLVPTRIGEPIVAMP